MEKQTMWGFEPSDSAISFDDVSNTQRYMLGRLGRPWVWPGIIHRRRMLKVDRINKTIAAYDKSCGSFANKFMEFPPYLERVKEFIGLLESGMKVLDLGCGPGNVSRQLSLSGKEFDITGIDLSEEMLKLAQGNVPNAKFISNDIREINFPDDFFDVAILSFCIVHLTDLEMLSLLEKVSEFLKEKGMLYLSFMEGKKEGFERTSFSEEEIYFNYHSANRVEAVLKNNGLNILKVTKQDYPEKNGTITTDVFIFAKKEI